MSLPRRGAWVVRWTMSDCRDQLEFSTSVVHGTLREYPRRVPSRLTRRRRLPSCCFYFLTRAEDPQRHSNGEDFRSDSTSKKGRSKERIGAEPRIRFDLSGLAVEGGGNTTGNAVPNAGGLARAYRQVHFRVTSRVLTFILKRRELGTYPHTSVYVCADTTPQAPCP